MDTTKDCESFGLGSNPNSDTKRKESHMTEEERNHLEFLQLQASYLRTQFPDGSDDKLRAIYYDGYLEGALSLHGIGYTQVSIRHLAEIKRTVDQMSLWLFEHRDITPL